MKSLLRSSLITSGFVFFAMVAFAQTHLQPVRQAHVTLTVQKISFAKNVQGTFDQKTETVCIKKELLPVYDARRSQDEFPELTSIICDSTLGAKPIKVSFSGQLRITSIDDIATHKKTDVKTLYTNLAIYTATMQNENSAQPITFSVFATKDLGLHSMMQELWPNTISCTSSEDNDSGVNQASCTPNFPEFFGGTIEVEDAP